jgi:ESCRT-I complex subunit VPS28
LRLLAKDQLFPVIKDLASALQRQSAIATSHESKVKVADWLSKLAAMQASDSLSELQEREIMFDLEQAYHAFRDSFSSQAQ